MRNVIYILVVLALSFTTACTLQNWQPPSPVCDSGDSIILSHFGNNTKMADVGIRLANIEMIRANAYTREQCINAVDELISVVDVGTTGITFANAVREVAARLNVNFDAELMIIGDAVLVFAEVPEPLSECDKALILGNLENIKQDVQGLVI